MTDRLTDEQLREMMASHRPSHDEYKISDELLALRARIEQLETALRGTCAVLRDHIDAALAPKP